MARNKPNELYLTRLYDAPVQLVWDAWTDPEQVVKWWGPRGFTHTTHSKDLRPGGHWHYTMHGPDGTDYVNKTVYHEVEAYKRLVYDHGGNDERAPLFRVTALFSEEKGRTRLEMTMTLASAEAAAEVREFIKRAGGNATWDRLAEHLAEERERKDIFVINRTFEAPVETVFEMWTKPEHLSKWLGPAGFTMEFLRAEVRPGGESVFVMGNGEISFRNRLQYREITPPRRIVYSQQFVDEKGGISRHPLAPTWPETMLTTVEFAVEEGKNTRVTVRWEIEGPATKEERDAFRAERGGMTQGWTGSFDKLEELLSALA